MRALVILAFVLLFLTACGDQPPPRQPADPPAKKEADLLRQQELAAEKRAAEADAAGDTEIADYNRRLAKNLTELREKWERIESEQQAKIDAAEKKARTDAAANADRQRIADDRRKAYWIAGIGMAICAIAGGLGFAWGAGRLALPLAGVGALGCGALVAFWESLRWAWIYPVALGVAVLAFVAWLVVRRRTDAVIAGAKLADAFEVQAKLAVQKAKTFGSELDDRGHAVTEKAGAWLAQKRAGILKTVAKARGKIVKPQPPKA
jgi:hypothetical protein